MDADLTLAWVRAEIAPLAAKLQPPLPDANSTWSICEFLRDGRALCLLSAALDHVATKQQNDDDDAHDIGDSTLPKNLQRSLHQLSTFHALERIQYFIKWCRNAPLDAYLVFSSVQLLDELNEKIVCTCLNALRDKFRPELRAKYNDLMAAKAAAASDHAEVVADKKAADDAAAADPAVVSDEDDDANETKAKDNNAEAEEEHDIPATPVKATRLTSAPSTPLSQPKSANKLSAFLSKFPSETNVLTTVETAVEVAVDAPKVPEEVVEEHDDDDEEVHEYDHNDEIHEKVVDNEVEAVEKDESVAEEIGQVAAEKPLEDSDDEDFEEPSLEEESSQDQTQPRYTSAFSPRSSISSSKRSSRVSSVSFSFTSRKDSFSEDRSRNQSFSSVVSSPPASPKAVAAASRLRIPSIFEKNATGKKSESSGSTGAATDRSSSTSSHASSTKEDTKNSVAPVPSEEPTIAPKAVSRLEIPNVFSQGRANTEASATTVATVAVEATLVPKPRPVSKLQIPSAFAASSGGAVVPAPASSSAPAVATAAAVSVVEEVVPTVTAEATPVPEASPKPVSKLNIPAAFVRSTSTTSVERSPAVKSAAPESPFSAVTPELKKKPSRLKIPSVFGASSSHDTPPSPKRSEPETQTIEVATASTASTDVEPAVEAAPAVAEIAPAVVDASPVSVEATPAPVVFASPKAEAIQSPVSRPSPIAKPASKLAAFLSTVVVTNVPVPPASEETDGKIDKPASEDPSFEPRFSESQETKIGLPCDSQEPATSDDSAAAQESFEKVSAENVEIEDSDNSDDDAVRDQFADERLSDDLFSEQIPQESSSETVALGAEVHAVSEELLGDYVEVEQHNFDNHDHADGEQPFFVVEEVSLSKPSANSKLFAFLSSVDSAHPHPSSHTSEADEAEKADSVGSAPSRHSGSRKSALSPKRSVEDASEHSERSVRTSMTAISLAVSSEVILEKERLSGENLALSQKLKTVEESLSAKESEFASLKAELEALKHQLAAEQANSEAKLKTVVEEHETLVSKIRADHLKEITATRAAAHDDALVEKQNQNYDLKIAALEEQNKALEQQLQIAKDSEEAARYSAQLAFAARDEAETLLRSQ